MHTILSADFKYNILNVPTKVPRPGVKHFNNRYLLSLLGSKATLSIAIVLLADYVTIACSWRKWSVDASSNAAIVLHATTTHTVGRDWRGWILEVKDGVGVGETALG